MADQNRPIYITTPIYYVNDKPHVGHAYTTIVADFLTRAFRLLGREAFFLTGTDEHGAKVSEAARERGMTPQQWCDLHARHFQEAWKRLEINYDYFIRTTDKRHEQGVIKMLERLRKVTKEGQPVIYEGEYVGLYCLGCEKFITEKELVDGLCPNHLTKPQELREKNYFFRLKAYLAQVEEKIRSDEIRVLPIERKNEVLGLFKQNLEDFSISREKVDWGIPLPWDPSQNAYVWVDALPNYITATGYGDNERDFGKWWKNAQVLHLMAKDILKFHAVYWPAMLLAIGEKPPETIFIHGYFTVNGQKMSKTLRNTLDPHTMVDQFGPDGARYLLLTQFPFGQDGDLKADLFVQQFNSDLANDLGNLVSRVVKLANQYLPGQKLAYQSSAKPVVGLLGQAHTATIDAIREFRKGVEDLSPSESIGAAMKLVRELNRWFDGEKPWKLAKSGDLAMLEFVLGYSAEATRVAAILLSPVIPSKSREILRALGFSNPEAELSIEHLQDWGTRPIGPFVLDASIFPRMEKVNVTTTPAPEAKKTEEAPANVVTIDQFRQTQLRTALVVAAEKVVGADKLLKLQVTIGTETRQIVSGIALHYKPEDLIGKTIIVLTNLKPSKIRGVESNGMLLAASQGETLRLLTTDGPIEPGSSIT